MLLHGRDDRRHSPSRAQRRLEALPVLVGFVLAAAMSGCDRYPLTDGLSDNAVIGHPAGYADPILHGSDTKVGKSNCPACHGPDLGGVGAITGCDACHQAGWRTRCNYCHGTDASGAPPPDLLGRAETSFLGVGSHAEHGARSTHPAYPCTACHSPVTDVLTPGHLFDSTPGRAEVVLSSGLSKAGQYAAPGCTTVYCHGSGRTLGSAASFVPTTPLDCQSCHPTAGLSFTHSHHAAIGCQTCHATVAANSLAIGNPDLHVNGSREVSLQLGSWNAATRTCSQTGGPCHAGDVTW